MNNSVWVAAILSVVTAPGSDPSVSANLSFYAISGFLHFDSVNGSDSLLVNYFVMTPAIGCQVINVFHVKSELSDTSLKFSFRHVNLLGVATTPPP